MSERVSATGDAFEHAADDSDRLTAKSVKGAQILGLDCQPSYLHGHSGILRASSRHLGDRRHERAALNRHRSARLLVRPRGAASPRRYQTHRPRVPKVKRRSAVVIIMRLRRLMGTSRRPPIGWPQRAPGVRRPRVTSGLLEPRPQCRSTSCQASVSETPNVDAPGCVRGRRTRLIAGPWARCPTSGERATGV